MIEIIQAENWDEMQDKKGLPKNIKQIGVPDMGDRIYIEDSAYQKMHPYGQHIEKMVYVMLGRFDDFAGRTCVFVEDVVKMNEVEFKGKLPQWNDDSWGYLYRKIRPEHENLIIVGWAVDICGQFPSMTAQLERVHQTYFGGTHQILFLLDTLEREEAFYGNKNGYLKRREGFYIYYDKSIPERMESAMTTLRAEKAFSQAEVNQVESQTTQREERYRDYLNSRKMQRTLPRLPRKNSYSSTLLLMTAILALGYTSFQNHQQMKSMEHALSQMELQATMQTEVEKENAVRVEQVLGTVTPIQMSESTETLNVMSSEVPSQTEVVETSTQAISESDIYLQQGYYVVQSGDNLAGICRKIYHTTAMMNALCAANDIEDPDAIFAGQKLLLPN
ncbi:MAG: LysM peptidoglycan-binding domain-containing protein [Roseburia sp.]|nr:LysM peptidoglycan-binding domain-containing protein [Roseburia sp.]